MAFRRGGILLIDMKFYYNNVELSIVNHFFLSRDDVRRHRNVDFGLNLENGTIDSA